MPADGERMCYEEVILTVRGEAADHLSASSRRSSSMTCRPMWWPGDPPFNDPVFDQLVEMGDRVLFDSSDFGDLLGGLRRSAPCDTPAASATWPGSAWPGGRS